MDGIYNIGVDHPYRPYIDRLSRLARVLLDRACKATDAVGPRTVVFGEYRLALYAS